MFVVNVERQWKIVRVSGELQATYVVSDDKPYYLHFGDGTILESQKMESCIVKKGSEFCCVDYSGANAVITFAVPIANVECWGSNG